MIKLFVKANLFFLKSSFQVSDLLEFYSQYFSSIQAEPAAEILWDKDGQLIGDDSPFRIEYYGDGRATLYIPEVFVDDQGYYTCTARNTLGSSRTTARLNVNSRC